MKKINLIVILFGFSTLLLAQVPNRCSYITPKQTDNWLFFKNVGIKFTDAGVVLNNFSQSTLPAGSGTSTLSDIDGNLLLYSDGISVLNGNHDTILNGPQLKGYMGSIQSSLIVPRPEFPENAYVFTTDILYPPAFDTTKGFNYSKVDMIPGSPGTVTHERNVRLLSISSEMLSGVLHANKVDYWVVTHGAGNNNFYAYLVTKDGVNTTPVVSSIGSTLSDNYMLQEYVGAMKISPKGDKIAYASFGKGVVELFSFDNGSGTVSNVRTIIPPDMTNTKKPYYVEFSPDGALLYFTVAELNSGRDNQLYQYEIATQNLVVLNPPSTYQKDVAALQLGRDGKIYVSRLNQSVLGVIENPNRIATDCNYKENGINLGTQKAMNGLPNFISSFLDVNPVDFDTKCDGDTTVFTLLNTSNIDGVDWDFGDPASPTNLQSNTLNPSHVFSVPGTYDITYTERFAGKAWTFSFPVTINQLPPKSFEFDSLYIVDNSSLNLDAGANMFSYFWQDGSANRYYNATVEGIYTAIVEDINCCRNSDTLTVVDLNIKVPTAFSPNGDGINDVFRVLGPVEGITDFTFTIYNKWGQLVWETDDFLSYWEGNMAANPAPAGIYSWMVTFNVKYNQMNGGKIKFNGTVTLFR